MKSSCGMKNGWHNCTLVNDIADGDIIFLDYFPHMHEKSKPEAHLLLDLTPRCSIQLPEGLYLVWDIAMSRLRYISPLYIVAVFKS